MRFVMSILGASVLFLSGMITGYHYAQSHWYESSPVEVGSKKEGGELEEEKEDQSGADLSKDLLERQKVLKKEDEENIFSSIGRSLDFFDE